VAEQKIDDLNHADPTSRYHLAAHRLVPRIAPNSFPSGHTMKTTALAEAMICAFSAIFEVLPTQSQRGINSILSSAIAAKVIKDANALRLLECLVDDRSRQSSAGRIVQKMGRVRYRN
jgi:hypothetical protein